MNLRKKAVLSAIIAAMLFIGFIGLVASLVPAPIAGIVIAAMSGFTALSTAFGFQILSLRREVRQTTGLDEERRALLKRRLDRSLKTLFLRWSLSFGCGMLGSAVGLSIREAAQQTAGWLMVAGGFALCFGSIFFLVLMVMEYRSLLQFSIELEDHAEERKQKREWAERMGKVAKG